MKKTVLGTGGLGFIGSYTVVELLNQQEDVIIVDDLRNSSLSSLEGIKTITKREPKIFQIDDGDWVQIENLCKQENTESIVHFTADKSVNGSLENPLKYHRNNVASLITLVGVKLESDVENFMFSSSCCLYGEPDQNPISEKSPIKSLMEKLSK